MGKIFNLYWQQFIVQNYRRFPVSHRVFSAIQLAITVASLVLWIHLPPPGWAVAILAMVAAAMSIHGDMKGWQKAIWMVLIGALLIIELRSISKDRTDNDLRVSAERVKEEKAFKDIREAQDADFIATEKRFENVIAENQRDFDATIGRSDRAIRGIQTNLDAVTGSKSFPNYFVTSNFREINGEYRLNLVVIGAYPMKNMQSSIETIESKAKNIELPKDLKCESCEIKYLAQRIQSKHALPLGEAEMLPNVVHPVGETLPVGKYQITTFSMSGMFFETLTLELDEKGQLKQTSEIVKQGHPPMIVANLKLVPAHIVNGKLIPLDNSVDRRAAKYR